LSRRMWTYIGTGKEPVQRTGFRHGEELSEARTQNRNAKLNLVRSQVTRGRCRNGGRLKKVPRAVEGEKRKRKKVGAA
jgi:hypothetical protein